MTSWANRIPVRCGPTAVCGVVLILGVHFAYPAASLPAGPAAGDGQGVIESSTADKRVKSPAPSGEPRCEHGEGPHGPAAGYSSGAVQPAATAEAAE